MRTLLISIATVLVTIHLYAGDAAPSNLVGYVISFDQTLSGRGVGTVTCDAQYTYFSSGDTPEPYVYEKLGPDRFRVINFDPDQPQVAWSHLLFTFTNSNSGTIFDEDDGLLKGTFQLFPPNRPTLDIVQQAAAHVLIGVTSQPGQIIVLQQSPNLVTWTPQATNVSWTGRWEVSRPASASAKAFFRAFVPTQ